MGSGVIKIISTMLIAAHEGLRTNAYKDSLGIPTIGKKYFNILS